jgi:hypothetical protein
LYLVGRAHEIYQRNQGETPQDWITLLSLVDKTGEIVSDLTVSRLKSRPHRLPDSPMELLVGATSSLMLIGLELYFWLFRKTDLFGGFWFNTAASTDMMQTLELNVLRQDIFGGLWYLHSQPPGFDLLRLLLATPEILMGSEPTSSSLDLRLYVFSALLYGLMNGILFFWAQKLSHSKLVALITVVLWSLYPGNLAMVTYLDSIYLSTVLLTLTLHFWMLWYVSSNLKFALASAFAGIGVTLVRTSLQPALFLFAMLAGLVLLLRRSQHTYRRRIIAAFAMCAILLLCLPVKQFVLFGTFSTTTSAGHHLLGMIRYQPTEEELRAISVPASILRNAENFQNKYNNSEEVITNYKYSDIFLSRVSSDPAGSFRESLISASRSLIKGAGATQDYNPNILVESLPWAGASSRIFSGLSYLMVVTAGITGLVIARRETIAINIRRLLVAAIPPLVVLAAVMFTVVFGSLRYTEPVELGDAFGWNDGFTWTESNRVKFLLEPVFFSAASLGLLLYVTRATQRFVRRR